MQARMPFMFCLGTAAIALSACGGGGGGGPRFAPAPPPAAPQGIPVVIFSDPQPGNFASVGVSRSGTGGNLDTYSSPDARFGEISSADSDQPHIRYTADGHYEIQMPGNDWDRLVHHKGLGSPTADNNYFQPASVGQNLGYLIIANAAKWDDYSYSEMGGWGSRAASRYGYVAFGMATPDGGVPTSGSATFEGKVMGSADVMLPDNLYGGYVPLYLDGSVTLNFDFGSGTLAGAMTLNGADGMNPFEVGTFAFRDTVFSAGSTTYSGAFETSASGENFFLGRFTGPNAEETIGAWAVPFVFTSGGEYAPADGQTHQAYGAWIARRP